ncbi:MAG: DNA-directed RNA polymerase subunit beta, partial [Planctomycetota bacterium]|nr:DNA-directed RNA polymerase subunit beta [Planctomycetota bacterium]
MPIPPVRTLQSDSVHQMGALSGEFEIADLTRIQTESFARFLQLDRHPRERKGEGLEEIMREIFPVESYDGQYKLEYLRYELGKPRYTATECRQLRLTYGRPFRIWLRLVKEQPIEEEVYLGDIPIMLGGGEFIINGAERVVVSQLHRSPGVDFVLSSEPGEKKSYSCRIIPERGSWIELVINKNDELLVRIDQSGKFSAMTLLRAMNADFSSNSTLVRTFYQPKTMKVNKSDMGADLVNKITSDDLIYPAKHERVGEIILLCGQTINAAAAQQIVDAGFKTVDVLEHLDDQLILNSLRKDATNTHEEALLKIYQRLRPGNPPQLEKAMDLFREKFFDVNRYRLGRVGRFRINRKFNQDVPDAEMTLRPEDFVNAIRYLLRLRASDSTAYVDDIDNLGNRRL